MRSPSKFTGSFGQRRPIQTGRMQSSRLRRMQRQVVMTFRCVPLDACRGTCPRRTMQRCIHVVSDVLYTYVYMQYTAPIHNLVEGSVLVGRQRCVLPHEVPVNPVPPLLEECPLAPDTVILQPDMLPCVYAQQWHYIDAAQRLLGPRILLLRRRTKRPDLVHSLI
jgi:hypothetical protein